jgi:hypothetical protein
MKHSLAASLPPPSGEEEAVAAPRTQAGLVAGEEEPTGFQREMKGRPWRAGPTRGIGYHRDRAHILRKGYRGWLHGRVVSRTHCLTCLVRKHGTVHACVVVQTYATGSGSCWTMR